MNTGAQFNLQAVVMTVFRILCNVDGVEAEKRNNRVVRAACVSSDETGQNAGVREIGFAIVVLMPVLIADVCDRQYRTGRKLVLYSQAVLVAGWAPIVCIRKAGDAADGNRSRESLTGL